MILPIRIWPDVILTQQAEPVSHFGPALARLVEDMFDTMYAAPGRGPAAPQVGISQRLFVMDVTWKEGTRTPRIFINPTIVHVSRRKAQHSEGCLSLPGFTLPVRRPEVVEMTWQDESGTAHHEKLRNMEAVCAQHEFDHLDGVLILDRVSKKTLATVAEPLAALQASE
jgi:peptide deformylase